jgi:hypothetical protein
MNSNHLEQAAAAALLRYLLPSNEADVDLMEQVHTTRPVWIRGRQYLLDVTVDPFTFDVLSYRLRSVPREKRPRRLMVA